MCEVDTPHSSPLLLTTIPVNFWGVWGQTIYLPLSIPSFFPSDVEQG